MERAAQFRDGERVDSSTVQQELLSGLMPSNAIARDVDVPARRAATAAARPMGAFSTGVPVDWGLSQRPARVDCRLSYTTGQAIVARSATVACYIYTSYC